MLAGTLGATVGALVAYAIGAWGGRPVLERWGKWIGITADDLDKADSFFAKHGEAASFFGRMIPVIRSLVSFAAGVAHMPLLKFTVFTFLGSLPWTALLVFAGVQLGANWETVGGFLKSIEYLVLAGLVAIAVAWAWFRHPQAAAGGPGGGLTADEAPAGAPSCSSGGRRPRKSRYSSRS